MVHNMQVLLALVIVGSTAWLAVDASKRDWTDNGFAKNVPTWVVGSLILWIVIFPLYVFVHRKKAPLLKPAAGPEPAIELSVPEPIGGPEPVVELSAPEPVVELSVLEPAIELEPQPTVEPPALDWAALAAADQDAPATEGQAIVEPTEPDPVEASVPEVAPDGLSLDAFEHIKPVAFGSFSPASNEPAADEPAVEPEPEVVVEEPEPVVAPKPEIVIEAAEPVVAFEPEPAPIPVEPEPVAVEPELVAAMEASPAPEPAPAAEKRGSKFNPKIKLTSFGERKQKKPAVAAITEPKPAKAKKTRGGLSLKLPPQLEGPLNNLERKIVLGSVVAVVAAAALGYKSAPGDESTTAAPAPPPAPTAAAR